MGPMIGAIITLGFFGLVYGLMHLFLRLKLRKMEFEKPQKKGD